MKSNSVIPYDIFINQSSEASIYRLKYNCYYITDKNGNLGYFKDKKNKSIIVWRANTSFDYRSVSSNPSFTSNQNLIPNVESQDAWNLYGNGSKIDDIDYDILGNKRNKPDKDGTCIGAYEFAPNTDPPESTTKGSIKDNTKTDFYSGDMLIASITWHKSGGTLPDGVDVKYFSGKYPPDLTLVQGSKESFVGSSTDAYWDITPSGGSGYTYDIELYYDDAMMGTINIEDDMLIAKKHGSEQWRSYSTSVVEKSGKEKYVKNSALTSFSTFTITSKSYKPLPINLVKFEGVLKADKKVMLFWSTASETNNDYFTIERSTDCIVFDQITTVKGAGNSNSYLTYNYLDDVSGVESNFVYYRLKQTDYDGKFSYSEPIIIKLENEVNNGFQLLSYYPNPFVNYVNINFEVSTDCNLRLDLYNSQGVLVLTRFVDAQKGFNNYIFSMGTSYPNGYYLLEFTSGNTAFQSIKLYKQI